MKALKHFIFLTFLISFILFPLSQLECQSTELQIQKITEHLYVIFGLGGNVAFLVTDEGVLVIDSKTLPSSGEEIVTKIRQVTDKEIRYLIYTHYHGDHVQGAQSFPPSVLIISHSNTRENIEKFSLPRLEETKAKLLPKQLTEAELKVKKLKEEKNPKLGEAEKELEMIQKRIKEFEELKLILPQITLETKSVIHIGGQRVELLYMGNGHTNGDLLVYFPLKKAIHMGDLLFNNIIPYIDREAGSNTRNWIKILEEVEKLDIEKVIPGHGEIADKKALLAQTEYLKDLRAEVSRMIQEGLSLNEIKKKIDLSKYQKLEGYSQRFFRNVEAVYSELMEEKKSK